MKYGDMHVHTYYSDGIYSPKEAFEIAKSKGIKKIAITDHDTFYHLSEARKLAYEVGIELINGVEVSCYNYDKCKKIHVVALNIPNYCPNIEKLCNKVLAGRNEYHKKMIQDFNKIGYEITFEDAKRQSKSNTVFKMHIFQAIKEKYPDIDDNFYDKHFRGKVPPEVELQMNYVDIRSGIEAIIKDGGIPILAHPNVYDSFPEAKEYIDYGIKGIEINHPRMKSSDIKLAKEIAQKYNLLKSGGSDFHKIKYTENKQTEIGQFGLSKEEFLELQAGIGKYKTSF